MIVSIVPLPAILFPKYILNELIEGRGLESVALYTVIMILSTLLLNVFSSFLSLKLDTKANLINLNIDSIISSKALDLDFEMIENPEILDLLEKARFPIKNQNAIRRLCQLFS